MHTLKLADANTVLTPAQQQLVQDYINQQQQKHELQARVLQQYTQAQQPIAALEAPVGAPPAAI